MTYGTMCLSCGTKSERTSTFLELEVNLTVRSSAPSHLPTLLPPRLSPRSSLF